MQTFIQLVVTGRFDSRKDTKKVNEVLAQLQMHGAIVKSVKLSASSVNSILDTHGSYAVYVITYEAAAPIEDVIKM
jgi:hypothetical protein